MITIKFRGKSIDGKEWLYGDLVRNENGSFAVVPVFELNMENDCTKYEVGKDTIGQFTGLSDKNGKEIYEGDLLECDEVPKILSKVYWNCSMSAFCLAVHTITEGIAYGTTPLGAVLSKYKSLHIVSNIHDNPELLKGGKL